MRVLVVSRNGKNELLDRAVSSQEPQWGWSRDALLSQLRVVAYLQWGRGYSMAQAAPS